MKVILQEEVIGLGEPGKLVDVAPGYARNFLVPRKLAVYANEGNLREMEHHKTRLERKRQRLEAAAATTATRVAAQPVTIEAHAGPGGKLYGSVTSIDVAQALQQQIGVTIDRRKIHLREKISSLGEHTVDLHLMGETHAVLTVNVVDPTQKPVVEEAPAAPAPEAAPAE